MRFTTCIFKIELNQFVISLIHYNFLVVYELLCLSTVNIHQDVQF